MKSTQVIPCARLLGLVGLAAAALGSTGCATATIEPGHRGLYFAPSEGGLRREVLQPAKYNLGFCFISCTPNRIDDFDVTYSTKNEEIDTKSSEGLNMHLKLSVIYRPIVAGALRARYRGRGEQLLCRGHRARVPERLPRRLCTAFLYRASKEERVDRERGRGRGAAPDGRQARRDIERDSRVRRLRAGDCREDPAEDRRRAGGGAAEGSHRVGGREEEAAHRDRSRAAKAGTRDEGSAEESRAREARCRRRSWRSRRRGRKPRSSGPTSRWRSSRRRRIALAEVEMNKLRAEQAIAQLETQRKGVRVPKRK